MQINHLPKKIPVFPLSNFIIFPKTTVPLNIFEPRYIDMINDSMKSDKLIGMIQPLSLNNIGQTDPGLHQVGCLGKIISFKETENEGHHPDISFGWGYAEIKITTHAIEGLSENDFILAAKIDQLSNV